MSSDGDARILVVDNVPEKCALEVLVAEQLLHLAEVGARAEELRGEHVAERVRRHALALADAGRGDVVAEDLA